MGQKLDARIAREVHGIWTQIKTVFWAMDIFAVYLQIFKKSCELSRGMMLNHREQSFAWKMSQNYALWGTKSWGLLLTPTKSMKLVHFMIRQVRVFWVKIVKIGLASRPYFHGWYFVQNFFFFPEALTIKSKTNAFMGHLL